jgi:D-3-phosphoglycerate dehydrogenase/(S)-sulfolactate dehydrogenase
MDFRVLITSKYLQTPEEHAQVDRFFRSNDVEPGYRRCFTEDDLIEALPGIDGLMCSTDPVTARVLDTAPGLKVIARTGVGYETIDVPAATARGIPVCITAGANRTSVAELTIALMLSLARRLPENLDLVQQGGWKQLMGTELAGKTLGIAGLGQIGKAVAQRARAFEMNLLAADPFPDFGFAEANRVRLLPLEQLLGESDFVSLHLFLNSLNRHLINAERLALMKPTAYLINTSRGGIVDSAALYEAIRARRIAGAALDVMEQEPPDDSPLRGLPNVLLTPHIGGASVESRERTALMAAESVLAALRGERPANLVNPEIYQARRIA